MINKNKIQETFKSLFALVKKEDKEDLKDVEVKVEVKDEKIELEQKTLEDGTIVDYETLEVDQPIFLIVKEPLSDGEYQIDSKLVIVKDGLISNITEKEVEPEEDKEPTEAKKYKKLFSLKDWDSKEANFAKILEISKWEIEVINETFKVGDKVEQIINEEGDTSKINDGEYVLEDGREMHIDSDGLIVLIKGGEEKVEEKVEAKKKDKEEEPVKAEKEEETITLSLKEVNELKDKLKNAEKDYDIKLSNAKGEIEIQLEKLNTELNKTIVPQGPIEEKTKNTTSKTNEAIFKVIEEQRKEIEN